MSNLSRRDFTLVNHMLSLQVTVTAEWRDQAKMLAVAVANEQGYNVPDNHTALSVISFMRCFPCVVDYILT